MIFTIIALSLITACALWAVMTRSLLRAALGLALTSALLSVVMFKLQSPIAAVFELSVCTGLISVVFISTISLTQPLTWDQITKHMKDRLGRFWYLPVVVIIAGIVLSFVRLPQALQVPLPETVKDVKEIIWNVRHLDIIGQILIFLAGSFGVRILFKERHK